MSLLHACGMTSKLSSLYRWVWR
uniref:Uncharacterized protein n=1 Tax=Anguilla anguilla TaxID=7936 RepID=A0A0E9V9C3_ANGAN